jgi:hypothetical protein
MRRRWPLAIVAAVLALAVFFAQRAISDRPFPSNTTPDGAYVRIGRAITEGRPRDAFAYLETEAQWAAYSIRNLRSKASERVRASYPLDQRAAVLAPWAGEASAPDGADVFALLAAQRGWITRLERDLSGAASVEIHGDRATVVTGRGTRYSFHRRDNGMWGLTLFTAELQAEAERAARDLEVVERAAGDYERAAQSGEEKGK